MARLRARGPGRGCLTGHGRGWDRASYTIDTTSRTPRRHQSLLRLRRWTAPSCWPRDLGDVRIIWLFLREEQDRSCGGASRARATTRTSSPRRADRRPRPRPAAGTVIAPAVDEQRYQALERARGDPEARPMGGCAGGPAMMADARRHVDAVRRARRGRQRWRRRQTAPARSFLDFMNRIVATIEQ